MKKIIAFLLCLGIVLSVAACVPSDRPDDIDNGSQPSISETEPENDSNKSEAELYREAVALLESGDLYGAYDIFLTLPEFEDTGEYLSRFSFKAEKRVDERTDHGEKLTYTHYYEYDEYGRTVLIRTVDESGKESTYGYIYNDKGNLVEEQYGGAVEYRYEYDDAGNAIKLSYPSGSIELEYDENGNIVKIISGNVITEKKYNEDGKVIEISKHIGRYTKVQTRYYDYNDHGDLIRNTYCENEKVVSVSEIEWEYNEAGKPIKRISTSDGEVNNRTEYAYYESGVLKEELYFNGTKTEYTSKIEYDEKGNLTARSIRSSDGEKLTTYYYEYDEYGNTLRADSYQSKTTYFGYKLYYNPSPAKPIPDEIYGYGPGK